MADVFIHVGLPKTASKYLQYHYFGQLRGVDFHTTAARGKWPACMDWAYELNNRHDVARPAAGPGNGGSGPATDSKAWIERAKAWAQQLDRPLVLSSEGLCGVSWAPWINNREIAEILAQIFGRAKILFIFRRQADWLDSIYRQLIFREDRFGRYYRFDELYGIDGQGGLYQASRMDWSEMVRNYAELFGRENVLALPYEELLESPDGFIREISAFSGLAPAAKPKIADENSFDASSQGEYLELSEAAGRLWGGRAALHLIKAAKARKLVAGDFPSRSVLAKYFRATRYQPMPAESRKVIMESVRGHNLALAETLGVDLARYGYC